MCLHSWFVRCDDAASAGDLAIRWWWYGRWKVEVVGRCKGWLGRVQRAPPSPYAQRSGRWTAILRRGAILARFGMRKSRTCRTRRRRTLCGEKAHPQLRRHATGPHLSWPEPKKKKKKKKKKRRSCRYHENFAPTLGKLWLSRALSFQPTVSTIQYCTRGGQGIQCNSRSKTGNICRRSGTIILCSADDTRDDTLTM